MVEGSRGERREGGGERWGEKGVRGGRKEGKGDVGGERWGKKWEREGEVGGKWWEVVSGERRKMEGKASLGWREEEENGQGIKHRMGYGGRAWEETGRGRREEKGTG